MEKVKILVVEDEIIIADNICSILQDLGYELLEPEVSFHDAVESIKRNRPDLLILDIQLSGRKDGIDLAEFVNQNYSIPFIFLTSNADQLTVSRAKEVSPKAYLVKPFSREDLYSTIEIALYNPDPVIEKQNKEILVRDALFVKQQHTYKKLQFEEILFLKSDHVYVDVFATNKRKFLIRSSLHDLLEKLDKQFLRTHRSYIVNMNRVEAIEENLLIIDNFSIPISKSFQKDLMSRLNIG